MKFKNLPTLLAITLSSLNSLSSSAQSVGRIFCENEKYVFTITTHLTPKGAIQLGAFKFKDSDKTVTQILLDAGPEIPSFEDNLGNRVKNRYSYSAIGNKNGYNYSLYILKKGDKTYPNRKVNYAELSVIHQGKSIGLQKMICTSIRSR